MLKNWTKYDFFQLIIGQVNAKEQPHGICRLVDTDGFFIFEGQFMNGELSGSGRAIGYNAYYVGEWKEGNYHGFGTEVSYNGCSYVGGWEENMRHGSGKYTKADGNVF